MSGGGKKTAVILMGHGSRVPDASGGMERVAQDLRGRGRFMAVETCHMSRLGPFFPETLAKAAGMGAETILLIPYFLHMGLHMRLDIPQMMQEEAAKYPGVKLILGKHLGYDESLARLVEKRIGESMELPDVREMELAPRESFPLPEGEMEFVAMPPEEAEKYKGHGSHHCNGEGRHDD